MNLTEIINVRAKLYIINQLEGDIGRFYSLGGKIEMINPIICGDVFNPKNEKLTSNK